MRTDRRFFQFGFFLALLLGLTLAVPARAESISIAAYLQQLEDIGRQTEQFKDSPQRIAQLEAGVPEQVTVTDGSREYTIHYKWLKAQLKLAAQPDSKRRSAAIESVRSHLQSLRDSVRGYETRTNAGAGERGKLNEILARREFAKVHGLTLIEIWVQRILRKIAEFFGRHSTGRTADNLFEVFIYVVVAVALSFFAIWIKRRFYRPQQELAREIMPFAPSARGWRSWLAEARAAAQQEDWRNSIHLAYWAGISFLEDHGAWRPDRARTPREYLTLLTARHADHSTLTALTRKFEVVWYGHRDASATDFQETLGQLEKLGCR